MEKTRGTSFLLYAGLVLAFAGAASASVTYVNTDGKDRSWTFKEFGIGTNTFRPKPVGFDRPTVVYRLPRYAHEGGASWWILHLHIIVVINPRSAPGSAALIGAGANQVGTAYIRLNSKRKNGHDVIVWTENGILNGVVSHVARSNHIDIWFSDYLPIAGVRPGRNELTFMVGQKDLVKKLAIMPDSSIEHTRFAPAQINLSERLSRTQIAVGELVRAQATVSNVGGNVANRVEIALDSVPGALAVIGPDQRELGRFKPNRVVTASFLLRASRIGRFPIGISASSSSNQRAALRYVTVSASPVAHSTRPARPTHSSHVLVATLIAAIALLGFLALFGGVRLPAVAPLGAGFLACALALAFWSLLIDARLAWSISIAATSLATAFLLARVVMRRIRSGGALVLTLVGISVLTLVLNAVFLFVLVISANI
jgi:hypothetical protein